MIDEQLARRVLNALKPPTIVLPSTFVESELRLPASANAQPGPLTLATFQRELVDAIADDETEIIVLMLASQIGKSLAVDSQMLATVATAPGPMLHVSVDRTASEDFVKRRFNPLVEASPTLSGLIGSGQATRKGSTGGANSLAFKQFPGGTINFVSSFMPSELAARSARYVWMDEIDRFAQSAQKEGDPVLLAFQRTERWTFAGRKVVLVSTPTSRQSRIADWFGRGDKRRFFVTCPDCGHSGPITFEMLQWTKGKPETAALVCDGPECGVVHSEAARVRMLADGVWVPTAKGEKGIRSYHITAMASEQLSLESIAKRWDDANTAEKKQVFYNVVLAEPFDSTIEYSMSSLELRQRAEPWKPPYSADIEFVTAGIDVQDNRVEIQFVAHHPNGVTSILNHLREDGDTFQPKVWRKLDELLGETFRLSDGRVLPVLATAIDGGHRPDPVIDFVFSQLRKSRNVVAVKGVAGFNRPFIERGGKLKRRLGLYIVGVDSVKSSLYSRLRRLEYGAGFIHVPDHLPDEFYKGLASEAIETVYVHGFARTRFVKNVRDNEALDACVYAHAVAELVDRTTLNRQTLAPKPGLSFAERAARLNGG